MVWLIGAFCTAFASATELSLATFSASAALIGAATLELTSDIAARSGRVSTVSASSGHQEHRPAQLIALDTGLRIERSDRVVVVQITQQSGKEEQKKALYARLAELLEERGVGRADDLAVSISENTRADWSFGRGRAVSDRGALI